MIIALDAGHSHSCPGAEAGDLSDAGLLQVRSPECVDGPVGHNESDLTWDMYLRVKHALALYITSDRAIRVVPIRNEEEVLRRNLARRTRVARLSNADAFISLHFNSHTDEHAHGFEVLYRTGDEPSRRLADEVRQRVLQAVNDGPHPWRDVRDRGLQPRANLAVLNGTYRVMPSCLIEYGFLAGDRTLVHSKHWRELAAIATARAVVEAL